MDVYQDRRGDGGAKLQAFSLPLSDNASRENAASRQMPGGTLCEWHTMTWVTELVPRPYTPSNSLMASLPDRRLSLPLLPTDIVLCVFTHCDFRDLLNCSLVRSTPSSQMVDQVEYPSDGNLYIIRFRFVVNSDPSCNQTTISCDTKLFSPSMG